MKRVTTIVNELRFEKLVYGGDALARDNGMVVMTPLVLPGELARVEIPPRKGSFIRGRLLEVMEPSPERVQAPCPYFGKCGGCHYQHARYQYQPAQKVEILREMFRRVAKMEAPPDIPVVAGPEWGYRNRVQLHFDQDQLGFHAMASHRVVGIDFCAVASPMLNQAIAALGSMMRDRRWPRFIRTIELFTNEIEVQLNLLDSGDRGVSRGFFEWCATRLPGVLTPWLDYDVGGDLFRVSHKSFFQVNRFLINPLVDLVVGDAAGDRALDLFAGAGLFSLPLAARFEQVTAVESGAAAVSDLAFNAQRAGLDVEAVRANAESYLESLSRTPDLIVADPPRAGLGKQVVQNLIRLRPERLVIVSCDPSTLARDLAWLTGYDIESLTLIDLFPHTSHIETVTSLTAQ